MGTNGSENVCFATEKCEREETLDVKPVSEHQNFPLKISNKHFLAETQVYQHTAGFMQAAGFMHS